MAESDITKLRKAGRLQEAYALAKALYEDNPSDIWNKRNMAWVLYDYAKSNVAVGKRDNFIRCLQQIVDLHMPSDETMFFESVGWLCRSMVASCVRAGMNDSSFFDRLFSFMKKIDFPANGDMYSALLATFLRLKVSWLNFDLFCEWWNLDNLRPEDYEATQSEDGQRILSLAERTYMAYSKSLLANNKTDRIQCFLPKLQEVSFNHRNYIYLPYYHAKMLIKIGCNQKALDIVKPFVRRKKSEFWVWELLGDAMSDNESKLILYSKAMLCRAKQEMTVALRENMAMLLYDMNYLAEAKYEIIQVIEIRNRNKWKIDDRIVHIQETEWYKTTSASISNISFYEEKSSRADELVFDNQNDIKCFEGILKLTDKGFGFIGKKEDCAFVPAGLIAKHKLSNGDYVKVKAKKSFDKKKNKEGYTAINIYQ